MTTRSPLETDLSLFEQITRTVHAPLFTQSHPSLIKVSHEIENGVLHGTSGARVFAGFQKLSFLLPILSRYEQMALVAESVWVFGYPDVELPSIPGFHVVELPEGHTLVGEWFLVVESANYFSALVAKDISGFEVPQHKRLFRGVWTFNAAMVEDFQQQLSRLVAVKPLVFLPQERDYNLQTMRFSMIANQLIQALQQRNDDLIRTQTMHTQLFNMIVHDLRNPLAGMIGFIDLIERELNREDQNTERLLEFVQETRRSHAEMHILIDNILDIHKFESGQFPVKMSMFAIEPLLQSLCERYSALANVRRIALEVELDQPGLMIYADQHVLQRVLANLLSNALRHTVEGGVTLHAEQQHDAIVVKVSDSGEGIAGGDLPHVFSPYYQGAASRARGAVGLGLTFCKRAIEAQQGDIWAESRHQKGSTFFVKLPAYPPTTAPQLGC